MKEQPKFTDATIASRRDDDGGTILNLNSESTEACDKLLQPEVRVPSEQRLQDSLYDHAKEEGHDHHENRDHVVDESRRIESELRKYPGNP